MNSITVFGRFTADPETKALQDGKVVCNFSIADNFGKDSTSYFRCVAFNKTGELLANCKKADRIVVSGRMEEESWTDQQTQQPRKGWKLIVKDMSYVEAAPQNQQQNAQPQGGYQQPPAPGGYQAPAPGGYQQPQQPQGYQQQQQYGAPPAQYGQQPAPQGGYQQQPPQQQYQQQGYGQPPQPQYGAPPAGNGAPPAQYGQPPQGGGFPPNGVPF